MKAAELHEDIRKYCRANASKAIAKKYSRYFKEGYDTYGLTTEKFNKKLKSILKDKSIDINLVISTGNSLGKSGKYEETNFAICLLKEFSEQFNATTFRAVEKWFQTGIINWAHTDITCSLLLSKFFEMKIISLKDLSKWRIAKNKNQRRAVPVAMLEILKTTKNFKPLFTFIEPLTKDEQENVQQGLGWFLREAWKSKKKQTESFLLKWKNHSPRKIYLYATEKTTPLEKKDLKEMRVNNYPIGY